MGRRRREEASGRAPPPYSRLQDGPSSSSSSSSLPAGGHGSHGRPRRNHRAAPCLEEQVYVDVERLVPHKLAPWPPPAPQKRCPPRCQLFMLVFFVLFLFYVLAYDKATSMPSTVSGWSYNTSRDTRTYVLPDNVTLLNQPKSVCRVKAKPEQQQQPQIYLLAIVTSAMANFEARAAIRETWGNHSNYVILHNILHKVNQDISKMNLTDRVLSELGDANNFSFMDRRMKRELAEGLEESYEDEQDIVLESLISDGGNETEEQRAGNSTLGGGASALTSDLIGSIRNFKMNTNSVRNDGENTHVERSDTLSVRNENLITKGDILDVANRRNNLVNKFEGVEVEGRPPGALDHQMEKRDLGSFEEAFANSRYVKRDPELVEDPRFDHSEALQKDADANILGNFEGNEINIQDYDYQTEMSNIMRIPPRGYESYEKEESLDKVKDVMRLTMKNNKLSLSYSDEKEKLVKSTQSQVTVDGDEGKKKSKEAGPKHEAADDGEFLRPAEPVQTKYLFLLGQSANENDTELQGRIDEEAALYGDIIQESFIDSYNNLTLKSIMLLKWVVNNCGDNVRFILKADDDMFVNVFRLVEALRNKSLEHMNKTGVACGPGAEGDTCPEAVKASRSQKLLMGDLICEARPINDPNSKWYSPTYMYGDKTYPRYLSGTSYVMSMDTVPALYRAALETPLFHLEDIFITGMCSRKAGITPIDHSGFSYAERAPDACVYLRLVSAHRVPALGVRRALAALHSEQLVRACELKRIANARNASHRNESILATIAANLGLTDKSKKKRPANQCS